MFKKEKALRVFPTGTRLTVPCRRQVWSRSFLGQDLEMKTFKSRLSSWGIRGENVQVENFKWIFQVKFFSEIFILKRSSWHRQAEAFDSDFYVENLKIEAQLWNEIKPFTLRPSNRITSRGFETETSNLIFSKLICQAEPFRLESTNRTFKFRFSNWGFRAETFKLGLSSPNFLNLICQAELLGPTFSNWNFLVEMFKLDVLDWNIQKEIFKSRSWSWSFRA